MSNYQKSKEKNDVELENLSSFFELLLKIDMRQNPELYEAKKEQEDD